jgi:hypothetical protein
MAPFRKNLGSSLLAGFAALVCLGVTFPAGAGNPAAETNDAPAASQETDQQAKRQKMIEDCKSNRGVDCEQQVDTELQAGQPDSEQQVIRAPTNRRRR